MKIVVNVSITGDGFDYSLGDIVDRNEFSMRVGAGWEALCAPVEEFAVKQPLMETATKHRRRK